MKVYVVPENLMLPRYFPVESIVVSKRIWRDVKIDYVGSRHVGFTVEDKILKTKHSVIYMSEKKFPKNWNCDCEWFSIKGSYCKHILAVNIFLQRMRDVLPFKIEFVKLKNETKF